MIYISGNKSFEWLTKYKEDIKWESMVQILLKDWMLKN